MFWFSLQLLCEMILILRRFRFKRHTRGAGKSLARPERIQARKNGRDARNLKKHRDASCHQVFFPASQGAEGNSRHS